MSNAYQAIHQELKRLQKEGLSALYVSDQVIEILGESLTRTKQTSGDVPVSIKTDTGNPTPGAALPVQTKAPPSSPAESFQATPAKFELPQGDPQEQLTWLEERVQNCPVCRENLNPNGKIVFGTGSVQADIFFCGEAPGAEEEKTGEPFVGKAGQLLTKIIQAMGLKRDDVYIANILKWRPQHDKPYGNRPPTLGEMQFCLPYVKAQIQIIQPKVIVALGNTAVSGLLGPDPSRRMGTIRGTWQSFEETPLMITFHPSYLLRNDTLQTKRLVWEDMLKVMKKIELPISEKQQGFFLPKK